MDDDIKKLIKKDPQVLAVCQKIADYYRGLMAQADYDKNGELYNFKTLISFLDTIFELYFILPDYWVYAEEGSRGVKTGLPGRKGPPPLDAILKWVKRKGVTSTTYSGVDSTTAEATRILWKIYWWGTEGKHLLLKTIDETYNTYVDELVDALEDALLKQLENDLEEL